MIVIPVIDLLDGLVVRARMGQRACYQPINSPLCADSDPLHVVQQLMAVTASDILYIADLNSIQGNGNNLPGIRTIAKHFPEKHIWLDAGIPVSHLPAENITPVLGSESCQSLDAYVQHLGRHTCPVLSLDFKDDRFLGPVELLSRPEIWPRHIILMCLDAVGSGQGAEISRLQALLSQVTDQKVYAAGGVRHLEDLQQLSSVGCSGALIASALHDLSIDLSTITSLRNDCLNEESPG